MQSWNTPDHHIADTEHGTLHFADGVQMVIADWEITEDAPDADGRVYAAVRGWLANGGGTGRHGDPYTQPIAAGRARLVTTELRGRQAITDRDVHVHFHSPGRPHPNTWDHQGLLVTIEWMDRHLDGEGRPVPETEIGLTSWTHPETGRVFDLTVAYLPEGEHYHPLGFTWRHYDHWSSGAPLLEAFYGDHAVPSGAGVRSLTDGEWVPVSQAPTHPVLGLSIEDAVAAARS
ncbi:hypothetical protein [Kitasatospora sp. NBC_01302]|uniref:hypothetical protein n=1 Tax=Kitasatospora sp. NBC_01302 TaxID=2903575 RepID=UPI002E0EC250|nr:hypothetical protein OG294_40085 [Kitasatospora sp. NBC_01302]